MAQVAGTRRVLLTGVLVVVDVVDDVVVVDVVGVAVDFDCVKEVLLVLFDGLLQGMQRAMYLLSPSS